MLRELHRVLDGCQAKTLGIVVAAAERDAGLRLRTTPYGYGHTGESRSRARLRPRPASRSCSLSTSEETVSPAHHARRRIEAAVDTRSGRASGRTLDAAPRMGHAARAARRRRRSA